MIKISEDDGEVGEGAKGRPTSAKSLPTDAHTLPPRQQTRRLYVGSIATVDNRPHSNGPGNFEVILGQEAKDSGLWDLAASLSTTAVVAGHAVVAAVSATAGKKPTATAGGQLLVITTLEL